MALSARIPGASDLVSLCRHKLEGIFDMHGVKTGSRTDVPGFLEKLHNDRYFAMDFWALVESLEETRDRISEEQIRRTVAECVCGWVPNGDPALAGIEEEFDARMARRGEGVPSGPRVQAAAIADEAGLRIIEHSPDSMSEGPNHAADENIAASELKRRDSQRELPVVELGSGAGSGTAGRIDQILTRLELNDHELKLLLESIESRISRLEPHVEELTSQVEKSRHPEAKAESTGGIKNERSAGMATAWFGRRQTAEKNDATTTEVLASQGMESADLRFTKMSDTATAAEEFDGAIARTLKPLPSKRAMRRTRRLAMLRVGRGQIALRSLASRLVKSLEYGMEKGTATAAEAVAAARSFERKFSRETAPELLWLTRRREMLSNVAKGLGVGACLWLMIWLWGRPQADFVKAAPTAASSTAAAPVTQEKPADARAADGASTGARAGSVERTADVSADSVADGAAAGDSKGGMQRVASQVTASKGRDYTAPPWTKWYGKADETKSQGASGRQAEKSAGR